MRIARLRTQTTERFARLEGRHAHAFDEAPWLGGRETGDTWAYNDADLLCPVVPSKIVCVGRNYAAHARELGHAIPREPLLFLNPPSSLAGPGDAIVLPPESARIEHEAELAAVVGRRAKKLSRSDAPGYIVGYTCACDVTARDLQSQDVQYTRSKGFDTFCPLGPWIETDLDVGAARICCRVGERTRQDGAAADMIFDVPTLVAYISQMMTLQAGDGVLPGTPQGGRPLVAGAKPQVAVRGIGALP